MKNLNYYFKQNSDKKIISKNNEADDNYDFMNMYIESTIFNFLPFSSQEFLREEINQPRQVEPYDIFNEILIDEKQHEKGDEKYNLIPKDKSKEILDKIDLFENNYFHNTIINEKENEIHIDNSQNHNLNKCSFKYNLKIAENTLPGAIISYMHNSGKLHSFDELIEYISPKFGSLKKSNGTMYKVNFYIKIHIF